jgi:hypothetical protein
VLSTVEARYMAALNATKEAIWLHTLLEDLGCTQTQATTVHGDNEGCIALSRGSVTYLHAKHIDIQHHFIRECVAHCKGTSVHFLTSPLISHFPLSICIPHPHLCTISKDYTYSRWLSRSRLTNNRRLPDSHSARTLAASDEPQTHWDRFAWHYGTLRHHMDTHIWEAWY